MSKGEIRKWCEENLFGDRVVHGIYVPLSSTQTAILDISVEIIEKWENRTVGSYHRQTESKEATAYRVMFRLVGSTIIRQAIVVATTEFEAENKVTRFFPDQTLIFRSTTKIGSDVIVIG